MLCLTCTMISSVDFAHYRISRAKDWVSVDCGTICHIVGKKERKTHYKGNGILFHKIHCIVRFLVQQCNYIEWAPTHVHRIFTIDSSCMTIKKCLPTEMTSIFVTFGEKLKEGLFILS